MPNVRSTAEGWPFAYMVWHQLNETLTSACQWLTSGALSMHFCCSLPAVWLMRAEEEWARKKGAPQALTPGPEIPCW